MSTLITATPFVRSTNEAHTMKINKVKIFAISMFVATTRSTSLFIVVSQQQSSTEAHEVSFCALNKN